MRTGLFCAAIAVGALLSGTAKADGLLYQLPDDGDWVRFDMEGKAGPTGNEMFTGSLTMSSVGKATENGEPCRWIEFKFAFQRAGDTQERTIVAKVLVPEKHLGKGKAAYDNYIRGWMKQGENEVQALDKSNSNLAGPLPVFLCGPLLDQKELPKLEVDGKLGKLDCAGVTGRQEFTQGEMSMEAGYETRLHEKAPFGVATSQMTLNMKRNGETREAVTINLNLADLGKATLTELPNNN